MRTHAAAKETYLAPESQQTGEIYNFIAAHEAKNGFEPEPKFFLSGGEVGDQVEIPKEIYKVLVKAVEAMRNGLAVTIAPSTQTLTTQQAAEVLGVTRPTLVKMLDEGKIAFEKPGAHRRVQLVDVLAYRKARRAEQYAVLDSLSPIGDEDFELSAEEIKDARREAARRRR